MKLIIKIRNNIYYYLERIKDIIIDILLTIILIPIVLYYLVKSFLSVLKHWKEFKEHGGIAHAMCNYMIIHQMDFARWLK